MNNNPKQNNQKNMDRWMACAGVGIVTTIIMYFIMMNCEELETMRIFLYLFLASMAFSIFSIVMTNVYNAKVKNMNAEEYLNDRFENCWKETKETFGSSNSNGISNVSVKCPYCNSYNTHKISGLSKAGSVALWGIFALGKTTKQWHCNSCKSDF